MAVAAPQYSVPDLVPLRRALLSVSDKSGLVEFAGTLNILGVELLSTGGTAKTLMEAGLPVIDVGSYTKFPEMMDGRVKTLHPKVHGGILALRDVPDHAEAMKTHDIPPIDLVVVNLYPFEETVAKGSDFSTCVENIDIGGPSLIRGAAKNHGYVTVVVDPKDYQLVTESLSENQGQTTLAVRKKLAAKAYGRTAAYDAAIAQYWAGQLGDELPDFFAFGGARREVLRYGENPHQKAAVYLGGPKRFGVATAEQLQGKELSYNNLGDTDAAFELVAEFDPKITGPACAIIKHGNPCGVAQGSTLVEAYQKALACDPVSAFGGIVAFNLPLDGATAEEVVKIFTEVVIAPEAADEAQKIMGSKKNLRLLVTHGLPNAEELGVTIRPVAGGFLVQSRDSGKIKLSDLKLVSKRAPTDQELQDMIFAFTVGKHVKSNAIVYAKNLATVGIGAGQMSRVDSSRIAAWKAEEAGKAAGESLFRTAGSAVASDAFFPFADGLLAASAAGATAVIQPGGSVRDSEVIEAADSQNLAMMFTGMRHFRH